MMNKKLAGIALAAAMAASLAACGSSDSSSKADTASAAAASTAESTAESTAAESTETASAEVKDSDANAEGPGGEGAGFQEYPIFEDETVGFMNVSAVYFQPVPMTDGNGIENYNIHIEADVSANENKYGYGVGDWVPYLTVDYKITASNGDVAAEGKLMPMSASDGPHYGANIKLDKADTYSVEFQFHSPAEMNYLLHTDAETGPGGSWDDYFKDGNLKVTYDKWDYVPQEW